MRHDEANEAPKFGGVRFGPALAGVLYALLVASAALALWVWRAPGRLPAQLALAAPWMFLVFLLLFGTYRYRLVRGGKYPAGKAFFQIGAGMLFFMLLLPRRDDPLRNEPKDDAVLFLHDSSPKVRALAAEVAGCRGNPSVYGAPLVDALKDPDGDVRERAHQALVRLHGKDLGRPEDAAAVKAWEEAFR